MAAFPWWYQRIYLGNGVFTRDAPALNERIWERLRDLIPDDLAGASVLDVGTNAGFFAIEMTRRSAGRVVGLEVDAEARRQAALCTAIWGTPVELLEMDANHLERVREPFDLVVFTGILYHLKSPLAALEEVGRLCRDAVIVESEVIAEDPRNRFYANAGRLGGLRVTECRRGFMKFVEGDELNDDPTNWWVPDRECVRGMLRVAGFPHLLREADLAPTRYLAVAAKRALTRLGPSSLPRDDGGM